MQSEATPAYSHSSTSDGATFLRVVNLVDVPRGGFHFDVIETGVTIKASSIARLKAMVRSHFDANRLRVPPDFDSIIETTACRNLGEHANHWCCDTADGSPYEARPARRSRWTAADVLRFARTVKDWGLKTGFAFVDQAEATRRASICATCPMNVRIAGCLGCAGVEALVTSMKGDRKTPDDIRLETCDVCGCYLKAKVWLPDDALDNSGLTYPSHCWQKNQDDKTFGSTSGHEVVEEPEDGERRDSSHGTPEV